MRDLNDYQAAYLADYGFEGHMVRYRRRCILEWLASVPHTRMLEVGCGVEPLFEHVRDWEQYTVVEPGATFAAEARRRASAHVDRVPTVHESLIESAVDVLRGETFDCIVVSSVLHEVQQPAQLLAAVHALCSEDTRVHLNVPNANSLHNRLAVKMGLIPDIFTRSALAERMQRTTTYDLPRLIDTVHTAGFVVDSSGSYFLKPFTHGQLDAMLQREIVDVRVLDALYDVVADFPDAGAEIYLNVRRV